MKERLLFYGLMVGAGAIVGFLIGDTPSKVLSTILYAIGSATLTALVIFFWNLLRAPSQIYSAQQKEISSFKAQLKPTLQIEFKEGDNKFYYESQWFHELEEVFDNRGAYKGLKYWRLCRIALTNSSVETVESVECKLTSIEPLPKELSGKLPLPLHFMNDNIQPFKQNKNINPGATELVDVIGWTWDRAEKKPTFYIYHSINGIDAQFPVGDYTITIGAFGRNTICEQKTFYLGMRSRDGKAAKLWMSETPP